MNEETSFSEFADLSEALEKTSKRNEKKRLISNFLLKLREDEIKPAVTFLVGRPFVEADSRILEVGGRTLYRIMGKSKQETLIQKPLTILNVKEYFEEVAKATGKKSRKRKENIIKGLLSQTTSLETKYLLRILQGELKIGVVEGMMLEGISEATSINLELIQRCNMLLGSVGEVARIALNIGREALEKIGLQLFKPIKPMLAEMSYNLVEVLKYNGGKTAFEYKFDGARIQIHKKGDEIRIFSRRLNDVTESLPDIVELAKTEVIAKNTLVEGEVVAIGSEDRPLPFQDLMRRFRRVHEVGSMTREIPLKLYLFDILFLEGETLIDVPYVERWSLLNQTCGSHLLAKRIITDNLEEVNAFLKSAIKAGHEGLMAKALNSNYTPGIRGKKWFKIKPTEHLDLLIAAAEWGYGRRIGWLSNYHLAARDEETGEFLMLGKTFKGLADNEFKEMTRRLEEIKISEDNYTVYVKPEIVVEVAYNEIQKSPHYKSGFALRFARITQIRDDKGPTDVDTIGRIKVLYEKQFETKSKVTLRQQL